LVRHAAEEHAALAGTGLTPLSIPLVS
jgi:hypothetical protein